MDKSVHFTAVHCCVWNTATKKRCIHVDNITRWIHGCCTITTRKAVNGKPCHETFVHCRLQCEYRIGWHTRPNAPAVLYCQKDNEMVQETDTASTSRCVAEQLHFYTRKAVVVQRSWPSSMTFHPTFSSPSAKLRTKLRRVCLCADSLSAIFQPRCSQPLHGQSHRLDIASAPIMALDVMWRRTVHHVPACQDCALCSVSAVGILNFITGTKWYILT